MSLTNDLYGFLSTNANIIAVVDADNIMAAPGDLSIKTYPILLFAQTESEPQLGIGGPTGVTVAQVVLSCISKSPEAAVDLAALIDTELNGYKGVIGSKTSLLCYTTGLSDDFDDDIGSHIQNVQFSITYKIT